MLRTSLAKHSLEILEQRIAPAAVLPLQINENGFKPGSVGSPLLLTAGEGLTTGNGAGSGNYLLYVEKGQALIFTTDLNNNKVIDFNEITGISAGDGLRLISFVDIHGDIVTNLKSDTTLSDSDNNPLNDDPFLKGDGRVLLNTSIEKIELRSVRASDFAITPINDLDADGVVDDSYIEDRLVLSSYSVFGNILAGKSFGLPTDPATGVKSGLLIDLAGKAIQEGLFTPGHTGADLFVDFKPSIASIKTGTAASGQYFSFGISKGDDIQGRLGNFLPAPGQVGGDIVGVRAANEGTEFNLNSLEAGNGGIGARGGNINEVQLNGDDSGGYRVIAGNGGRGPTGGAGGSIIGFADFGSITSRVVIQSGDGGQGTTGAGGAGGSASFGDLNLSAGLQVTLGDGGDGFTSGGNGAGLGTAIITTPEGAVQFGLNMVGLATDPSKGINGVPLTPVASDGIGTITPIDIDEDGEGDYVFTSADPNQLVVVFGNPTFGTIDAVSTSDPFVYEGADGLPFYRKVYLDGTRNAEALVVGDFNADGHQDIAVASQEEGAFDGVTVFLNQYEDVNEDGILSPAEDLNNNGLTDFIGFQLGRHTPMPSLFSTDPEFSLISGFRRSANRITDIAAGDFDGDGFTDIAVLAKYYSGVGGSTHNVIIFQNDVEDGKPTGQFFADFGTKSTPTTLGVPRLPIRTLAGEWLIEATKLSTTSTHDSLMLATTKTFNPDQIETYDFVAGSPAVTLLRSVSIGKVDTDRDLPAGTNPHKSMQDPTLRDFTILDYYDLANDIVGQDGFADLIALTDGPEGFLVAMAGDGLGGFTITTNVDPTGNGDPEQNSGIFFGDKGFGDRTQILGIRATDLDGDGFDDIYALNYSYGNAFTAPLVTLDGGSALNQGARLPVEFVSSIALAQDNNIVSFDTVVRQVATRSLVYAAAIPTKNPPFNLTEVVGRNGLFRVDAFVDLTENSVNIFAGDGGDALTGKGGLGASIGGGLQVATTTVNGVATTDLFGAVNITLPDNVAYSGVSKLVGGNGGNGFSTGGSGGGVTGVVLRYANPQNGVTLHTIATLTGGDGGFGVSGAGGAGGSLSANSIERGEIFTAGDGGRGLTGGAGGSVIGNGQKGYFDSLDLFMSVYAGAGGAGVKKGGAGGNITGFAGQFIGISGNTGGNYNAIAGAGGSAVAGPGGQGGSVSNSGPLPGENKLAGEIYVQAGDGGLGLSGGGGGDIASFFNRPSQADNPTILSFIAGLGGGGISGPGGAGGGISSVLSPSTGNPENGISAPFGGYGFNRVIAGDGGFSAGGTGGVGGAVTSVDISASDGPIAIVSGAGGAGLLKGGAGGAVVNSTATVGGDTFAKVLVIAGAGGDAHAFIANPLDVSPDQAQKSFGGKVGVGGVGGNIIGFQQDLSISARVDLIAGNGGGTVNYGTVADPKSFVGKGGSITNTNIRGNIGNIDSAVPMGAYNDRDKDGHIDQSIADFVKDNFRISPEDALLFLPPLLDDTFGNVGIIVGSAGRIKEYEISPGTLLQLPATFALNGSLINLSARNLLSAVAGDINQIAAIQVASGIKIGSGVAPFFTPGIIGADKLPTLPGNDYLDSNGDKINEPVLDSRLVDGAFVAHKITDSLAGRIYLR